MATSRKDEREPVIPQPQPSRKDTWPGWTRLDAPPIPPAGFRESLRKRRPAWWWWLADRYLGPNQRVTEWIVRESVIEELAHELADSPGSIVVARCQECAGRDWPLLMKELFIEWSKE